MSKHSTTTDDLVAQIVAHVDGYLRGDLKGEGVSRWAAQQLGEHTFSSGEVLLDEALSALVAVGHADPRFDTPAEDLVLLRAALRGERDYPVALRWLRTNRESGSGRGSPPA